jgi:hypothetical protein
MKRKVTRHMKDSRFLHFGAEKYETLHSFDAGAT